MGISWKFSKDKLDCKCTNFKHIPLLLPIFGNKDENLLHVFESSLINELIIPQNSNQDTEKQTHEHTLMNTWDKNIFPSNILQLSAGMLLIFLKSRLKTLENNWFVKLLDLKD